MRIVEVKASRRAVDQFKTAARKCFPNETYAMLIGHEHPKGADIHYVWFPESVISSPAQILVDSAWIIEAEEWAREEHDMVVVGDIHSHPYKYTERPIGGGLPDHSQSEADIDVWPEWKKINGICRVVEFESGILRCSVRFWPPIAQVRTQII